MNTTEQGNGQGKGLGRGQGQGKGLGRGQRQGKGLGKGGNNGSGLGTGGFCICPKCGEKTHHQQDVKCTTVKCPKCGENMARE